ncbi:uncharacterized protein [Solanum lycopersicum]|uniref:uncharacterized protein n=1 Tax=Solanum lycopersicum TaxID=4081 RepID=UPI00374A8C24
MTSSLKLKPPILKGAESEDAYNFLVNCHELLHKMDMVELFGVEFFNYQFQEDAKMWWLSYVECRLATTPPMTWASFSRLFMEKYVPRTLRERRRVELMRLDQGRMWVATYEAKFHVLSRYSTRLCFSPQEWIHRFMKVLRSDMQIPALQVAATTKFFQELVDFVIEVEGVKTDNFTKASTLKKFCKRGYRAHCYAFPERFEVETSDVVIRGTNLICYLLDMPIRVSTPMDRDIDFCIGLESGTHAISIPRYRKALAELRELKVQLQELLGKANVVANAFSRKAGSMGSLAHLQVSRRPLARKVQTLDTDFITLEVLEKGGFLACVEARSSFLDKIKGKQLADEKLSRIRDMAHSSRYSIHLGATKIYRDLRKHYWWSRMKREIVDFVAQCPNCQQLKLTQYAHFILVKMTYNAEKLLKLYISEIVRMHGVSLSIISDRGSQFTSKFWRTLHAKLGTRLDISTSFHPQNDGQSERIIQVLEDMLRACVIDFGGHWDHFFPLAEFVYNNSYHSSIDMVPFEALYGRRRRYPIGWFDAFAVRPWGHDLLRESLEEVKFIKEKLLASQSKKKEYADRKVRDLEFIEGEKVLLKVSPKKGVLRFVKRGKLSPRYIDPFEDLKRLGEVTY